MKIHERDYPIKLMSRVLEVSRSGYYRWVKGQPSARSQAWQAHQVAVKAAHEQTRQTYGIRRLHRELIEQGQQMSVWQVRRARQALGLRCKQVRRFKATTDSAHGLPVAENLVQQTFTPDRPNQLWVGDITAIPTAQGWLYLAGIKDVFTCELVGYAMSARMTQQLCSTALQRAVKHKNPRPGLIITRIAAVNIAHMITKNKCGRLGCVPP